MSYLALARKWRPRDFASLVGQDHVRQSLINALDQDRLHHAFLFTGTRGVGKTTIARIFAKAINCERGVSSEPCGECSSCCEIDAGRFIDLIEVDAASRTGVDDTRDLLENVQYVPSRGRYKVYIIDEVHMFSRSSFNALLKTLEEPPPHVKFLLATTDPQKIPVTVLSRTLQFHLRPIAREEISAYLEQVATAESITSEAGALRLISQAAAGSMRDALSLMDQAIAYSGGALVESDLRRMLGLTGKPALGELLQAVDSGDGSTLMALVQKFSEQTPDFAQVLEELLQLIHQIAVAQMVPDTVDDSDEQANLLAGLAGEMTAEALQLYYQIGLIGRRDLPLAPDPRSGFEMVVLRMLAFRPENSVPSEPKPAPSGSRSVKAAPQVTETVSAPTAPLELQPSTASVASSELNPTPVPEPTVVDTLIDSAATTVETAPAALPQDAEAWQAVVSGLNLNGMTLELARNLVVRRAGSSTLLLQVASATAGLLTPRTKSQLITVLQAHYGSGMEIQIELSDAALDTPAELTRRADSKRQLQAEHAIEHDTQIAALRGRFDGEIEAGSIHPRD